MGELVFCSAEQPRALPSPFVLVIDIIFPVALPKGDVASFQSAGDVVGARGTGYPGGTFVFQVAEQTCLVFLPFPVEVGESIRWSHKWTDRSCRLSIARCTGDDIA
mgnify:CR=1 FL=1